MGSAKQTLQSAFAEANGGADQDAPMAAVGLEPDVSA
jgi:hypothetical protein